MRRRKQNPNDMQVDDLICYKFKPRTDGALNAANGPFPKREISLPPAPPDYKQFASTKKQWNNQNQGRFLQWMLSIITIAKQINPHF
jgi:hypothetical protein